MWPARQEKALDALLHKLSPYGYEVGQYRLLMVAQLHCRSKTETMYSRAACGPVDVDQESYQENQAVVQHEHHFDTQNQVSDCLLTVPLLNVLAPTTGSSPNASDGVYGL